ncbi:uncharacterized protein LOC100906065 [Galendromus occidentalis]|uniref:Uncharacterized protein LOC100906065 n=1 Tax=Galendromus occidentalis TaxID=34638 RepID=A0AAJ6VYB4_9ACAR|nr:uncharacterized protein LOC100906065 [Galendromus occidentalis]
MNSSKMTGMIRDLPNIDRVRRNLFGKSLSTSVEDITETSSLQEDQEKFRERWGFDVTTDSAMPDGNYEWERLDFDELPDAFKRMGGCRPRRYSNTSTGSSTNESGRSESFSSSDSFSIHTPVKSREARTLITDYLQSQAKRTRSAKEHARARLAQLNVIR